MSLPDDTCQQLEQMLAEIQSTEVSPAARGPGAHHIAPQQAWGTMVAGRELKWARVATC